VANRKKPELELEPRFMISAPALGGILISATTLVSRSTTLTSTTLSVRRLEDAVYWRSDSNVDCWIIHGVSNSVKEKWVPDWELV
jgi:hypothetical protein